LPGEAHQPGRHGGENCLHTHGFIALPPANRDGAATAVRDIAAAAGIAGSSVMHHFGTQRKLCAVVLLRTSKSMQDVRPTAEDAQPVGRMGQLIEGLANGTEHHPGYMPILWREMMENPGRLGDVHQMPLADFLRRAWDLSRDAVSSAQRPGIDPDMLLSMLGAACYFQVALPTFVAIRGSTSSTLKQRFTDTLQATLPAALTPPVARTKKLA
jgi:AcrR family transcriptional regulator